MSRYDVIVVGAGPAGCLAAKTASDSGCKTIILEEHRQIGIPIHCSGKISINAAPDNVREFLRKIDQPVLLTKYRAGHVFSPSGKVVKEFPLPANGSYLVDRGRFDQELARQAVNAGVDLFLNTRVTGLLKQDNVVIGVTTARSTGMPKVFGKVTIAADGINAPLSGIPKWAALSRAGQKSMGNIVLELTRVKDLESDIAELHTGAFSEKGWTTLWPRDENSCHIHFMNLSEYELVKSGDYVLSRKLKDSIPLRIVACALPADHGTKFSKLVMDGLILAGGAANIRGIANSMASGVYAGEVAAEAAKKNEVNSLRLKKYEKLCERLGGNAYQQRGIMHGLPFYQRSDNEIEGLLLEIIEKGETFMYT
ncbi:NAD(P)/FAD-dependent oxidoreductase [Thermodesulfobacteriota bacterium]